MVPPAAFRANPLLYTVEAHRHFLTVRLRLGGAIAFTAQEQPGARYTNPPRLRVVLLVKPMRTSILFFYLLTAALFGAVHDVLAIAFFDLPAARLPMYGIRVIMYVHIVYVWNKEKRPPAF